MTSLVIGATGFVGRHLVAAIASRGQAVRALCRDGQKARLYLQHGSETILGDACDPAVMRHAVAGVDVIYHCAAAHSTASAEQMRQTTLPSLRSILEAIRATGGKPRVILMSSINVLGNGSYTAANEDQPRRRTNELHVDLKIEAEELAEKSVADGLDIVILRPGLIYGRGDVHLPKLAQAINLGKFVFIGSCNNIVPLVHVSDMVAAMTLAAAAKVVPGRIYHITDGSATTIGELVGHLARILQCPEPKRVLPTMVPRVANSVCGLLGKKTPVSPSALRFLGSSRHVDIRRARTELGFDPRVGITAGVETIADWLRTSTSTQSAA